MSNLLEHSKLFFKRNASTILTCAGGAGVIATSVTAVKATPKALRLLEKAKEKKQDDLTPLEIAKIAGPVYIPSVLIGTATIACIFGANCINKRTQASLMSAYALLDSSYKDYKNKVIELYGEETDKQIRNDIAKDALGDQEFPLENDTVLFYDEYSKQYFETTLEKVNNAEYLINRNLSMSGWACLNEFYDLLELPHKNFGDILGWSTFYLVEAQWYPWIEFNNRKVELEDGLECYILEILTEPIPEFEEY